MKAFSGSRFIRALQVGGLLGLGVFLWGVCLLPIQRSLLVCECSVLVSGSEHSKLAELGRQSFLTSSSIDWLACEPWTAESESAFRGGAEGEVAVRRVRLRLGMNHRLTATELERELTGLTSIASEPLQPTAEVQRGICHARWRLQVAEHALTRFRLDCMRNGVHLSETKEQSSPFRLASRSTAAAGSDSEGLFDSLRSEVDAAREGLELAQRAKQSSDSETRAVFTLSGNPRFFMRGGSLDRVRFSGIVLSVCVLIGFVAIPRNRKRSSKRSAPSPCDRQDLMKILDGLRIPYLGVLSQEAGETSVEGQVDEIVSRGKRSPTQRLYRMFGLYSLSICSRWSERILVIWIVCFVLRYFLDPPWRELLFRAPLAAFSSVLFGV